MPQRSLLLRSLMRQYRFWRARLLRLLDIKGRTAWIAPPQCLAHFADEGHPESPNRIKAVEHALKRSHIWPLLQKVAAPEADDIQIARVHSRRYLAALEQALPQTGRVKIAEDTYLCRDTLTAARYAAGAAVKAVDMVMAKQAKNAFCATRPPGHHAAADRASGFCFINNVAVAAMHAVAEHRLQRIAILDFDLHHGDGTEALFRDDGRILFLSVYESRLFPFTDGDCGDNPRGCNTPLPAGSGSNEFRDAVRRDWLPRLEAFRPQLILLSAGFDGHSRDAIGHLNLSEADYEWLTKKIMLAANRHAKGRIVSILEGGYHPESLAASVKAHLACLVRASPFY